VREAPAPKMLCELGCLGLALDWANIRRLVVECRPEDDGAITSAWGGDEITSVIANALLRGTWNDQANRRTMDLRTDRGNE
jgi:hypothetical protein